jgi:alanine racemase
MPALKNVSNEATGRAWKEVDLGALRRNSRVLSERLAGGCRFLPMVKADAYGIGLESAVRALRDADPWGFGVARPTEGERLRRVGWRGPIVVFAPNLPTDVPLLRAERLEPVVPGLEALRECETAREDQLAVHLEVDTGMGRFGLDWAAAPSWARQVGEFVERGGVRLRGTLTHLHSADTDPQATRRQWQRFTSALDELRAAGVDPGLVHAANSAAAMLHEGLEADLVRPGIYLYGGGTWEPRPAPVLSVRTRVLAVRDVPAGATVGYGATWTAQAPARLATLGIGYGDGLRRELSNRGRALIRGHEAPIRGVVCMDVIVVDVTGRDDVRPGDVATLLGADRDQTIGLEEMARMCDTIDYEILTGWAQRLPTLEVDREGTSLDDELRVEALRTMTDGF